MHPSFRIFSLILLATLCGCTPFRNTSNSEIMVCGTDLGGRPFLKVLLPDGAQFEENTEFQASILNTQGEITKLEVTKKACVLYPESEMPQDSFLFVSAKTSTSTYSLLRQARQAMDGNVRMTAPSNSHFEWSCPVQIATSATQLPLATTSGKDAANSYVFEYRLKTGEELSNPIRIIQPDELVLDFSRAGKPLSEGQYQVVTRLYDLNQTLSFDKPSIEKTCDLTIDRTAPEALEPLFDQSDLGLLGRSILQVEPSQVVAFRGYENFSGQLYYCLDPIDESTFAHSKSCEDPKKFSPIGVRTFLPNHGFWNLKAFARDAAGNESPVQSWDLIVVDKLNLQQLKNLLSAAISVAPNDAPKALQLALSAYTVVTKLATQFERDRLRPLVESALLATGLAEIPLELRVNQSLEQIQYNKTGDAFYGVEFGTLVGWDRKTLEALDVDIRSDSLILDAARDRVYALDQNEIRILNLKGEKLNSIPWQDTKKPKIQATKDYVLVMGNETVKVLKYDEVLRSFERSPENSSIVITPTGILKFLEINQNSRMMTETLINLTEPEAASSTHQAVLDNSCFPNLTGYGLSYNPNGEYIRFEVGGGYQHGVAGLNGALLTCSLSHFDEMAFSPDGQYLVHVHNHSQLTLATESTLDFKLWELKNPESPKIILESTAIKDNALQVGFAGAHHILLSTNRGKQILVNFEGGVRAETTLKISDFLKIGSTSQSDEILIAGEGRLYVWTPAHAPAKVPATNYDLPMTADYVFGVNNRIAYQWEGKVYLVDGSTAAPRVLAEAPAFIGSMQFNARADRLLVAVEDEDRSWITHVKVLLLADGSWHNIAEFTSESFDWFGAGDDVIASKNGDYRFFVAGRTSSYQEKSLDVCAGHELKGWAANANRVRAIISCADGTLRQLHWTSDGWVTRTELKTDSQFSIELVDAAGEIALVSSSGHYSFWKVGSPLLRSPRYFQNGSFIMKDGRILSAGLDSSKVVIRSPVEEFDEEEIVDLDQEIMAMSYDPASDLIVLATHDRFLHFYTSAGENISKIEFKLVNKEFAPYYSGTSNFHFQEGFLKVQTLGGPLSIPLSPKFILSRYCDLQRNKDMSKDAWRNLCL